MMVFEGTQFLGFLSPQDSALSVSNGCSKPPSLSAAPAAPRLMLSANKDKSFHRKMHLTHDLTEQRSLQVRKGENDKSDSKCGKRELFDRSVKKNC